MRVTVLFALLAALTALAGCASTSPATADSSSASSDGKAGATGSRAARDRAMQQLRKGMTADEVRAAWGEPGKIAPMQSAPAQAEVWTYTFSFAGQPRQVQTSEITYTRPNPITSVDEVVREPVYSIEQTMIEQTVDLLFIEGTLTEWKQSRETQRRYD